MGETIIYGRLDDEERAEVEEEVDYLVELMKKHLKNPRDIVSYKKRTKTTRYIPRQKK